ncbi:MAG: ADP-ribose pyrophosphatase, partial [Planctomyces sp.]
FVLPVTDVFFVVEVESFADMRAVDGEITGWKFCRPGRRELNRMAFLSNRLALELYLQQTRAK